jgi:hypothetical protein
LAANLTQHLEFDMQLKDLKGLKKLEINVLDEITPADLIDEMVGTFLKVVIFRLSICVNSLEMLVIRRWSDNAKKYDFQTYKALNRLPSHIKCIEYQKYIVRDSRH